MNKREAAERYADKEWGDASHRGDEWEDQMHRHAKSDFLAGWIAAIEAAAKVALRLERSMTCPKTPSHALVQCADEIRKLAE
jgi:hypothetical protein